MAEATGSIQLALSDTAKADALRALLARSGDQPVVCVATPDFGTASAVVMDADHFEAVPLPLAHPNRVVLIMPNDPGHLKAAWEAGVNSVLSENDPLNTVALAVLAACLRAGSAKPKSSGDPPNQTR